ncbi:adenylyl-sulfate kinase, partial [Burkholderia pseudomallei]
MVRAALVTALPGFRLRRGDVHQIEDDGHD